MDIAPQTIISRATINIILASSSPRRIELLKFIVKKFQVIHPNANESLSNRCTRQKAVLHLCVLKAKSIQRLIRPGNLVITADTIVCLGNRIIGKPASEDEAVEMLVSLSGKKHDVFTGVCLSTAGKSKKFYVQSAVHFRKLSLGEIKQYIKHYKPFDKAGSYGVQELVPVTIRFVNTPPFEIIQPKNNKKQPFIKRIEGSYSNVMGLPLKELHSALSDFIRKI